MGLPFFVVVCWVFVAGDNSGFNLEQHMKEEWLFRGALVPIDAATTAALVVEIKRLIDVVGGLVLKQGPDYERGFVDGMSKQAQSSVDKAVNAMTQPSNFCPRCGKRRGGDVNYIHTCTPPEGERQ
jgi:hypothetical protein